jgi:hypothetical protein
MIAVWMLYATAISALVAGAAALAERAVRAVGRPGRFLWVAALLLSAVLPAATLFRPPGSAPIAERLVRAPVSVVASQPTTLFVPRTGTESAPATRAARPGPVSRSAARWSSWTLASLDRPLLVLWGVASSAARARPRRDRRPPRRPRVRVAGASR